MLPRAAAARTRQKQPRLRWRSLSHRNPDGRARAADTGPCDRAPGAGGSGTRGAVSPPQPPGSPSPASPPWKICSWQLGGLGPTAGRQRGDTEEPFPSFPRAATLPPAALTHPYESYSPPHTSSIITSVLAPLWEAYLTQILLGQALNTDCIRSRGPKAACQLLNRLCTLCGIEGNTLSSGVHQIQVLLLQKTVPTLQREQAAVSKPEHTRSAAWLGRTEPPQQRVPAPRAAPRFLLCCHPGA